MSKTLNVGLLSKDAQETNSPWYYWLCPWMKPTEQNLEQHVIHGVKDEEHADEIHEVKQEVPKEKPEQEVPKEEHEKSCCGWLLALKKRTPAVAAEVDNDIEMGLNPQGVHAEAPVTSLIAASTYTAQALITGVQGLAALLPILSNTHCGSNVIMVFAFMPLLGFALAATVDLFSWVSADLFSWVSSPWVLRFRNVGLFFVYTGYLGLAFILLLSRFHPAAFHSENCFKSP